MTLNFSFRVKLMSLAQTAFPPCVDHAPLERLREALDEALREDPASAAFALAVRAALAAAAKESALLSAVQREGSADCYRRHLLLADPKGRYAVAALVWEAGQASPVHGHHTWCAYTVIEGTLSETLFRWDAAAHLAVQTRRHARETGAVSFVGAGRGGIHRLGNAGPAGRAVSIHVYGVTGAQISTHVNDLLGLAASA
jgi:predicted metal-dependent enzyme (double-stranded beta helix superfamily)